MSVLVSSADVDSQPPGSILLDYDHRQCLVHGCIRFQSVLLSVLQAPSPCCAEREIRTKVVPGENDANFPYDPSSQDNPVMNKRNQVKDALPVVGRCPSYPEETTICSIVHCPAPTRKIDMYVSLSAAPFRDISHGLDVAPCRKP